jgi:signal transduction histidine kinase
VQADLRGEGLLHDARNLVSAIGLYCDLLSMPGVLRPEHRQYPEELRLLGTRSRVLIEHLLRSQVSQNLSDSGSGLVERAAPQGYPAHLADRRIYAQPNSCAPESGAHTAPVSLRSTVERCSGLLSRVANGRPIEVTYGAAADVPVSIGEEAIERILANLVGNAARALDHQELRTSPTEADADGADADADLDPNPKRAGLCAPDLSRRLHRRPGTSSLAASRAAIRISVGPLFDRIGEARSWPFQHVRLVVEDSGCGMEPKQLHTLLSGPMGTSQGTHGIGFRVVRELVAASSGDLCATSTPGVGTRIQIEWPVAATPTAEKDGDLMQRKRNLSSTLKSPAQERPHRSIPVPSHASPTIAGRQGVN